MHWQKWITNKMALWSILLSLISVEHAQHQPHIACEARVDTISPRLFLLDGTVAGATQSKGNQSRSIFVRGRGFGCVGSVHARLAHAHEQFERLLSAHILNETTIEIEMCKFEQPALSRSSDGHAPDPVQAINADGGAIQGLGRLPRTSAVTITLTATNGAQNELWVGVLFLDPTWPAAAAAAAAPAHQLWQLQLGCGRDYADRWLNLDALLKTTPFYDWGLASDQVMNDVDGADPNSETNLRRSLVRWRWDDLLEAFPLSSVAAITIAFAFGYITPHDEAQRAVFRAFERALRPGGVARIADAIDSRSDSLMAPASIAKIAVEQGLCAFEVDPWTTHYSGHITSRNKGDNVATGNKPDYPQPTHSPLQIARSSHIELWHSAPRRAFYLEMIKRDTSDSTMKRCSPQVVPLKPSSPSFSSFGLVYAEEMLERGALLPSLQPPPPFLQKPRARAPNVNTDLSRARSRAWWHSWLANGGKQAVIADARRLDAALGLNVLPEPVVHSGRIAASAMRVVICGLMRNTGAVAARSLVRLSHLCHHVFGQCVAIIVLIGTSNDHTERTAHAWAAHEPRAVLLHDADAGVEGVDGTNVKSNCAQHASDTAATDHGPETAERFRVMAGLRDRLLEEAEVHLWNGSGQPQGIKADGEGIVVMADLDMPIGWSERGILMTLGDMRNRGVDWHALTSHSVSWHCDGLYANLCAPIEARLPLTADVESNLDLRSGQPMIDPRWRGGLVRAYDSIAFRSCPPHSVHTRNVDGCPAKGVPALPSRTDGVREKAGGPSPHDPLAHVLRVGAAAIPVRSAFGGLSIYRASSLNGLRYSSHVNQTSPLNSNISSGKGAHANVHARNGAECEHVTLHRRLRARVSKQNQRTEGVVFLCPSMVVAHTHVFAAPSHAHTDPSHAKNTIPPFSHKLSGSGNDDIGSGVVVQGKGWFKAKPTSSAAARNWWYKQRHIRDAIPLDRASCAANLLDLRRALEAVDASWRSDTEIGEINRTVSSRPIAMLANSMWLSEGTALGVVRAVEAAKIVQRRAASDHDVGTEGFISHDDDVDVSFPYMLAEHFLRHALPLLLSPAYGFELGQVETERCGRRCLFIALLRRGEKIDIDFMGAGLDCKANSRRGDLATKANAPITADGKHNESSATSCTEQCDDMLRFFSRNAQSQAGQRDLGISRSNLGLALRPVKFLGTTFWLPQHAEEYLEYLYGSDWKIPRRTRAKPQYTQRK